MHHGSLLIWIHAERPEVLRFWAIADIAIGPRAHIASGQERADVTRVT